MNFPLFNSINDNIIIYNGENLPENIRMNITKSILTLFNKCNSIYDQKVYRSQHCIWFIISKNISEYYILTSLQNVLAKATNKHILIDAFKSYPYMLQNYPINSASYYNTFNFLFNLSNTLINTPNNIYDTFDLLE
jgi:hypothetical protein